MSTDEFSRVVSFNREREARKPRSFTLPREAAVVRDAAASWLFARMKEVFAEVDDSLFDTAEKVYQSDDQEGIFLALRTLRLERHRLIDRFVTEVGEGFTTIPSVDELGNDRQSLESLQASEAGLSLVQDDDLEMHVTLEGIVHTARRDFAGPIAELSLRLDTLMPVKIYDENMPLAPAALCRALRATLEPLKIHTRARLVLLKKFEKLVGKQLDGLYQNCNQVLVERGVLPDLKDPLLARKGKTSPMGGERPSAGRAAGPAATDGKSNQSGQPGQSDGWGLAPAGPGVVPMAAPELVQFLSDLQTSIPMQPAALGQVLNVTKLLEQRLVRARKKASLGELDTEVIQMVDMLFSFMLEDRNLAKPIKDQLIRLQLPMLKLGVADKEFFSKSGHPARRLLNRLADASIGWQAKENYQQDRFYREIRQVVERVLKEFETDEGIFATLLENFEKFVTRERTRARVMERRTLDEVQGRARIDAAKARVAAVMEALTTERRLPRIAQLWLNRVWSNVLFRACLKEGASSQAWRSAVLTARDLVWSAVAPMPGSGFKMQQLLPGLRQRLEAGARAMAVNKTELERLLTGLDTFYSERQRLANRVESDRERRTRERLVHEMMREADSVVKIPTVNDAAKADTDSEAHAAALSPADMPGSVELESGETDLPGPEDLERVSQHAVRKCGTQLPAMDDSDECWRQTYHLKDSWFMLRPDEDDHVRCRLAAIIRDLDQFILVNRNGAKVAVYTRLELAHALRDGGLKPLEDGPLFERALRHVVGNIGEMKIKVAMDEAVAATVH